MYRTARIQAGLTIENASERLFIAPRTLSKYEATKTISPETVLEMSEVYHCPHLAARYCSEVCPIGKQFADKVEEIDLAMLALGVLKEHSDVDEYRPRLIEIAADGLVDERELKGYQEIEIELRDLRKMITNLLLCVDKQQRQEKTAQLRAVK